MGEPKDDAAQRLNELEVRMRELSSVLINCLLLQAEFATWVAGNVQLPIGHRAEAALELSQRLIDQAADLARSSAIGLTVNASSQLRTEDLP